MIRILIDGAPAENAFCVEANTRLVRTAFANYHVVSRKIASGVVCHQLQRPNGNNWLPAIDLTQPESFQFWVTSNAGFQLDSLHFFEDGPSFRFGRSSLYANNLDENGVIDANLAGDIVRLTSANAAGNSERSAVSTPVLAGAIPPGVYNQIQAGSVVPGGPIGYTQSDTINPGADRAGLDLSLLPAGAWQVELLGGPFTSERVIVDRQFANSNAIALIDIFRDTWLTPVSPREYQLNFTTV